jgi:hypothetical protein
MEGKPGKSGRAVDVEPQVPLMAPTEYPVPVQVPLCEEGIHGDKQPDLADAACTLTSGEGALPEDEVVILDMPMYNEFSAESQIIDLYGVGDIVKKATSIPFVQNVQLKGPKGEIVRMRSVFDDGAMVNAIDAKVYSQVKPRLSPLQLSKRLLRMADGRLVPSMGTWSGMVSVVDVEHYGEFEVFDSGNAWALLFGKPLLKEFRAIHDYDMDEIYLPIGDDWRKINNLFTNTSGAGGQLLVGLTTDIKQRKELKGDSSASPSRQVLPHTPCPSENEIHILPDTDKECPYNVDYDVDWRSVWMLGTEGGSPENLGVEQPEMPKDRDKSIFTRKTKPHQPQRIAAILEDVTIGPDLTEEEHECVVALISEFADCFALSMSEVLPVTGAEHRINIPEGSTFRTKVHQRPLSAPQKIFYDSVIDKMLEADVIRPIPFRDVKCCGSTTLAKKAHEGGGLTLEELQHRVNDRCIEAGYPLAFEDLMPLRPQPQAPSPISGDDAPKQKWRVCQDFADLNKVTKVPAMPQGDIRLKQQRLCGHCWVSTFDFASGFYACPIPEEQQPYICFYVEGRGYFSYKRMPFGLTGAPSTFVEMTANALGDLVGTLFELFVDDGGMAGDVFETALADMRTLFVRVREKNLSLSAAKSSFFETESTFAGARVGPSGIKPDLTKLTAVVDWKTPHDLQNLGAFLGLTGYFRSLIKGYSGIVRPLTDLARSLELPKDKGKAAYK